MSSWVQSLIDKVYAFYEGIVDKVPNPFEGLSQLLEPDNQDSVILNDLRKKQFDLILKASQETDGDYNAVTRVISHDTKAFVNQIIEEEQKKLGAAPCEFTMFTLGSLAREETGPITDLEIGFLIKEKNVNTVKYFYQLTQNVSDRLFLLGEHPDIGSVGLHMDGADNAPPHKRFFARYVDYRDAKKLMKEAISKREWDRIPYEGSRPFLTTPTEFAAFSTPHFQQSPYALSALKEMEFEKEWKKVLEDPKNKKAIQTDEGREALKEGFRKEIEPWLDEIYRPYNQRELNTANDAGKVLGRNIDFLYGNRNMFDKFLEERESHFSEKEENGYTVRENIAKECLQEDIKKHIGKGDGVALTGALGKKLDIKRELYRMVEQFVTNLGFYYHCKKQNTIDIVNELVARNILHPEWGVKLIDYLQFATGLRLQAQRVLNRQSGASYFDQETFEEDKSNIEKKIANLQSTIQFMKDIKADKDSIATKNREYMKLKAEWEHLMDMAPGKIYSAEEEALLRDKYAPLTKQIFGIMQEWAKGKNIKEVALPTDIATPVLTPTPEKEEPPLAESVTPANVLSQGWAQDKSAAFLCAFKQYQALHTQQAPSALEMMEWGKSAGLTGPDMALYRQMVRTAPAA